MTEQPIPDAELLAMLERASYPTLKYSKEVYEDLPRVVRRLMAVERENEQLRDKLADAQLSINAITPEDEEPKRLY